MKPKIYAYSPFIKFLGGGEKYFANILEAIQEIMDVILICHEEEVQFLSQIPKLYNVNLSKVSLIKAKITSEADIQNIVSPDSIFFQVSNGAPLMVNCKKRILHHQIIYSKTDVLELAKNFPQLSNDTVFAEIKNRFLSQDYIFFSSNFIKQFMNDYWSLPQDKCFVIYPFVSDNFFKYPNDKKQLKIISVGRFEPIKKQKSQIELFIKMFPHLPDDYRLVLIGSNKTPLSLQLEKMVLGYPIEIKYALSESELLNEYSNASLYWSTTGMGVNDLYQTHNVESFGLAMAESMASGCVPVAINAGGVSEIIENGYNGFLPTNMENFESSSKKLLTSPQLLQTMSQNAHNSIKFFSRNIFKKKIEGLFMSLNV